MADVPLPLHSYRIESVSSARLVNTYAEKAPEGSKGPIILRRAPGIASFCACGTGPGRGLHAMAGILYAVSGSKLYRVSSAATTTDLGTIAGSVLVSMTDNATQLAISASHSMYVYDGALLPVSDPDVPDSLGKIDFLDNYLIGVREGTGQFVCSALADFTDFDALDFATAEGAPDNLLTLAVDHRAALLVGGKSSEIWENVSAGADFPFTRVPNGFIELGGLSRDGICKQDNSVFWLANDRTLRRLTGATPQRVSQHHVEREWRKYETVTDARCSPYTLDGHLCVAVTFPTADHSWIYDCTTNEWHERESYPTSAWDVCAIVECYGRVFVQRASTGEIGVLDPNVYSEWGSTLRAEWAYQSLYSEGKGIQVHRLEMGIQTGVGLESGQGSNPRIMLERSKLGGRDGTYRPLSARSLGTQGKFKTKVHWDGLGTADDHGFRAWTSDAVPLTVWNTIADAEQLVA
jgi:hypothetical protein